MHHFDSSVVQETAARHAQILQQPASNQCKTRSLLRAPTSPSGLTRPAHMAPRGFCPPHANCNFITKSPTLTISILNYIGEFAPLVASVPSENHRRIVRGCGPQPKFGPNLSGPVLLLTSVMQELFSHKGHVLSYSWPVSPKRGHSRFTKWLIFSTLLWFVDCLSPMYALLREDGFPCAIQSSLGGPQAR
jgi:hypothetical protein